jgi:hypothetical protein
LAVGARESELVRATGIAVECNRRNPVDFIATAHRSV